MAKSSHVEILKRVDLIVKLLAKGLDTKDIIQYCTQKTNWGVNERQVFIYLKKANEYFEEKSQYVRNREFGRALHRLNDLYSKCMSIQDFRGCLAMQKEINALLGIEAPVKYENVGQPQIIITQGRREEVPEPDE